MHGSFKISVLGKEWEVCIVKPEEDARLNDTDGFADWTALKIVIANRMSEGNLEYPYGYLLKVVRHELIHAFMRESGLGECAFAGPDMEEIWVDWLAIQWYKLGKIIDEAEHEVHHIIFG